jgi:hypothetical protein
MNLLIKENEMINKKEIIKQIKENENYSYKKKMKYIKEKEIKMNFIIEEESKKIINNEYFINELLEELKNIKYKSNFFSNNYKSFHEDLSKTITFYFIRNLIENKEYQNFILEISNELMKHNFNDLFLFKNFNQNIIYSNNNYSENLTELGFVLTSISFGSHISSIFFSFLLFPLTGIFFIIFINYLKKIKKKKKKVNLIN